MGITTPFGSSGSGSGGGGLTPAQEQKLDSIPSKATEAEAKAAADDSAYMTPAKSRQGLKAGFLNDTSDDWYLLDLAFTTWTTLDVRDNIMFFTGTPAQNTQLFNDTNVNDLSPVDWSTVTHVRLGATAQSNASFITHSRKTATVPAVDDVIYVHQDDPYNASGYAIMTVTAVSTVGTGNAKYYQLTVTTLQVGAQFGSNDNQYFKLTDEPPAGITIPQNFLHIDNSFLARMRALSTWIMSHFGTVTTELSKSPEPSYVNSFLTALKSKLNSVYAKIADVVLKSDIQPKESDFWVQWQTALLETGVEDKRTAFVFTSDGSGAPSNANAYSNLQSVAAGTRTLVISPTVFEDTDFGQKVISASDISDDVLYFNFEGVNSWHVSFTPSGSATSVGSGQGQYFYIAGALAIVGTPAADPTGNNVAQVRDRAPSHFWDLVKIPWRAIVGEPGYVLPTGSNVSETAIDNATKMILYDGDGLTVGVFTRWHDQHHVGFYSLSGYTFTTAGISNQAADVGKIAMDANDDGFLYTNPKNETDKNALLSAMSPGKKITVTLSAANYRMAEIKASLGEVGGILRAQITDVATVGTMTNGQTATLHVEGNIPARSELRQLAFADVGWDTITEETAPAADDVVLIADKSGSYAVRRVDLVNLIKGGIAGTPSDDDIVQYDSTNGRYEAKAVGTQKYGIGALQITSPAAVNGSVADGASWGSSWTDAPNQWDGITHTPANRGDIFFDPIPPDGVIGFVVELYNASDVLKGRQFLPWDFNGGDTDEYRFGPDGSNYFKLNIQPQLITGKGYGGIFSFYYTQNSSNNLTGYYLKLYFSETDVITTEVYEVHGLTLENAPALNDRLGGSDESEGGAPNRGFTIQSVLDLGKPAVNASLTNVTETFANIGNPLSSDTLFTLVCWAQTIANDGSDIRTVTWIAADVPTSGGQWISFKGGQGGARIELKRNSSYQLQVRRQGGVSSTNKISLIVH